MYQGRAYALPWYMLFYSYVWVYWNRIMRTAQVVAAEMAKLHEELLKIREECLHPFQESINRFSYGYGTECSYWQEVTCLECGKQWVEDQ